MHVNDKSYYEVIPCIQVHTAVPFLSSQPHGPCFMVALLLLDTLLDKVL